MKTHPMFTCILAIIIGTGSIHFLPSNSDFEDGIIRMLLTGTMAFFLYFISGEKTLQACGVQTGYVLKVSAPFLIIAGVLGVLAIAGRAFIGEPVKEFWYRDLLASFYMFVFVGLFEELAFRAVINDAIIYRFRNVKHVFLISAIVCSFVFGYVHIMFYELNSVSEFVQAVGKTAGTGLFGLGLLFLYWKTRNIWACGLAHGLFDFMVSVSDCIFESPDRPEIEYVSSGSDGTAAIIFYSIEIIVNIFICIRIWKKIGKGLDFEELRKNW